MTDEPANPAALGRDVFVSYASQDVAIADAVVAALEKSGIRCWIAPRDVTPGSPYADEIVGAINDAKVLVLVLSQHAVASPHVGREIERAASKRRRIVALRTDAAPLTRGFEYFLSESQWIAAAALGMPTALAKLAQAVGQALAVPSDANPVAGAGFAAETSVTKRPVGTRSVAIASAILIALGLAVPLGIHFWPSKRSEAQAPTVAAISDKSIAVLPFADLSEKHDQEYFADGIAEEVLNRLAQVPGIKVVGRASSFQFRGKSSDPASIGTALGVAYLLEGSVRKEAGRVRVTAQLIDVKTASQHWADGFDSDVIDVLKVQDTIAAEIARALQLTVEVASTPRPSVKAPQALEAYMRGLQSESHQSRESSEAAVADFQQALSLDRSFAPAADGLARVYAFIGTEGWLPTRIAFERAREAALLAQRLDPSSASPHVSLAEIHVFYDWDWAGAEHELQQAFGLGPRQSYGTTFAAQVAAVRGELDEARQLGIEGVQLDPLNPVAHMVLGWNIYLHTGQFTEAEESFRRGLQIAPKWGSGQYFLGESLMLQGHLDAALAEFKKETIDDGQFEGSAMALFAAGRKSESDAKLSAAIRQNGTSWPSEIARVYAFRGEKDRALEWLQRAYDSKDEDLYIIKGDPLFKNLEGDPRYKAFLKKMNLPE